MNFVKFANVTKQELPGKKLGSISFPRTYEYQAETCNPDLNFFE